MQTPRKIFGGLGNTMFQMAYIYAQVRDGNLPDIYLQDEKYFEKYKDEIKAWYSDGIIKSDYVSIHFRRGDYLNNPFYTDLTKTNYYDKAIAMFPKERFLLFCADRQEGSDDRADRLWCEKYLESKGIDFDICEGEDEIKDLNAMAGCKHNILANSSFSIWCGILNPNPDKKVICPIEKKYYSDGVVRSKFPEDFIQIDFL